MGIGGSGVGAPRRKIVFLAVLKRAGQEREEKMFEFIICRGVCRSLKFFLESLRFGSFYRILRSIMYQVCEAQSFLEGFWKFFLSSIFRTTGSYM